MKEVIVNASKTYRVLIGSNLLSAVGNHAASLNKKGKAAIISDTNVFPIYGEIVRRSLNDAGFEVCSFTFPAGESSKCGKTYLEILNFLAQNGLTRSDLLIALGGGVVGDITGFAAATYLRGISYIQLPTTLLAMVDSSVGGKTAIDLPAGKNLCGAFYQPDLVVCDIATLSTLPAQIFRDGCAEVIKYGILYDPALFSHLRQHGVNFDRSYVVARCVELKRNVVAEDEFDRGSRQMLNLGHTVGHSIEACSNYQTSHGEAVGIGIAIVTRAARTMGICNDNTCDAILTTLRTFTLPTNTGYPAVDLFRCALSDKKSTGNSIHLILPQAIGTCSIMPMPIEKLQTFIEAGL